MAKSREYYINKVSDMMSQGKSGLKQGYSDRYAEKLLMEMKKIALKDANAQARYGYADFSQQREKLNFDEIIKTDPSNVRERNQQLRDLKSILSDPSSTPRGAEEIYKNLNKQLGMDLTKKEAVNVLNVMGKAQQKGVKTRDVYEYITEQVQGGQFNVEKLSTDKIEKNVNDLVNKYKEKQGYGISEEEKLKQKEVLNKFKKPNTTVKPLPKPDYKKKGGQYNRRGSSNKRRGKSRKKH